MNIFEYLSSYYLIQVTMSNAIKVKGQFKNIFMEETSPENPFGPNYKLLPTNAKINYKFNRMKGFIRPTRQDLVLKEDEDSKFTGLLLMSIAAGVALGGVGRMVLKRISPTMNDLLGQAQHFYYPIMVSITTTDAYFRAYDRYYEKVCKYFIDKYLEQAISNGFEDYQISK